MKGKKSDTEIIELLNSQFSKVTIIKEICKTARVNASQGAARDVLDVWVALLTTGIEFRTQNYDTHDNISEIADALYSELFKQEIVPYMEQAIREWLTNGISGMVITPYGPRCLKPDESLDLPDGGYVRHIVISAEDFKKRTGATRDGDSVSVYEAIYDGNYYIYDDETVYLNKPWRMVPRWLKGQARPDYISDNPLPLSLYEHIKLTCDYQDQMTESIGRIGNRASMILVNSAALNSSKNSINKLRRRYEIVDANEMNAINVIDDRSLDELIAASRHYDQIIASRSGINSFMMGIRTNAKFAREIQEMQASGSVRSQYIAEVTRGWLENIVDDYRRYLVFLPIEEHRGIDIHYDGKEYSFGPAKPYSEVLEGQTIQLSSAGQADVIQRRQDIQSLIAVLASMPNYDVSPLVDVLIKTFGLDPEQLRQNQPVQPQMPGMAPGAMPQPAQQMPEQLNTDLGGKI